MKILECKLLTDENIHPLVVDFLLKSGCDIRTVDELGYSRQSDEFILAEANKSGRLILTHDRDFGRLTVLRQLPLLGIIYLRPGHIDPKFTIATLEAINSCDFDLTPSFILVSQRRENHLRLRLRRF